MTKAAYELNLTQPAVSLQVRALEQEFGVALFERGGARLRLTQAGEALYRGAMAIFHAKDEAERAIDELKAGHKGKLVLGSNTTGGMYVLPRIIKAFRDLYPETEIILHVESTEWLYDKVLHNALDMSVVGGPTDDRRFGVEPVCIDPLALIVSPSHPFAQLDTVPLEDLEAGACIMPRVGSRTRQFVDCQLRAVGASVRIVMEFAGTEAVKKAVESNLGFAFVCRYAVEQEAANGTLRIVPVRGVALTRDMELIYRRQKYFTPVAERFRKFVHQFAAEQLQSFDEKNVRRAASRTARARSGTSKGRRPRR